MVSEACRSAAQPHGGRICSCYVLHLQGRKPACREGPGRRLEGILTASRWDIRRHQGDCAAIPLTYHSHHDGKPATCSRQVSLGVLFPVLNLCINQRKAAYSLWHRWLVCAGHRCQTVQLRKRVNALLALVAVCCLTRGNLLNAGREVQGINGGKHKVKQR